MDQTNDEMRDEYPSDLIEKGIRGKYYAQYQSGTNIVKLDPDVHAVFVTEEEVNEALRSLIRDRELADKVV